MLGRRLHKRPPKNVSACSFLPPFALLVSVFISSALTKKICICLVIQRMVRSGVF